MERLTKRGARKNGYVSAVGSGLGCWGKIIGRLAAYENTGLTPDDVTDLMAAHGTAIAALAEYRTLGTVKKLRALIDPPNVPLTLEELREMDGEPIWAVPLVPDHEDDDMEPGWSVFHAFHPESNFDGYGDRWLAYRRKPDAIPLAEMA